MSVARALVSHVHVSVPLAASDTDSGRAKNATSWNA